MRDQDQVEAGGAESGAADLEGKGGNGPSGSAAPSGAEDALGPAVPIEREMDETQSDDELVECTSFDDGARSASPRPMLANGLLAGASMPSSAAEARVTAVMTTPGTESADKAFTGSTSVGKTLVRNSSRGFF